MTPTPEQVKAARECATAIGNEVKRLGHWQGLGAALARGNVESIIAALLASHEAAALEKAAAIVLDEIDGADEERARDSWLGQLAERIRAVGRTR